MPEDMMRRRARTERGRDRQSSADPGRPSDKTSRQTTGSIPGSITTAPTSGRDTRSDDSIGRMLDVAYSKADSISRLVSGKIWWQAFARRHACVVARRVLANRSRTAHAIPAWLLSDQQGARRTLPQDQGYDSAQERCAFGLDQVTSPRTRGKDKFNWSYII